MTDYRVQRHLDDPGQLTDGWFTMLNTQGQIKAMRFYVRCYGDRQHVRLQEQRQDGWVTLQQGQLTDDDVARILRRDALLGEFGEEIQQLAMRHHRTPRWRLVRRQVLAVRLNLRLRQKLLEIYG